MSYQVSFVEGDLLSGKHSRYIAHGCNTQGVMGAGIARRIRDRWPKCYHDYYQACLTPPRTFVGGSAQLVAVGWPFGDDQEIMGIFNLGTQVAPGADATTELIRISFINMAQTAARNNIGTIGIPRIGCGIGGLDWHAVQSAIEGGLVHSPALRDTHLDIVVHDFTPAVGS